jgi:hypothetical protein
MRLDLIDEFRLDLHPDVAGECTRLFDDVARFYRLTPIRLHQRRHGRRGRSTSRAMRRASSPSLPVEAPEGARSRASFTANVHSLNGQNEHLRELLEQIVDMPQR